MRGVAGKEDANVKARKRIVRCEAPRYLVQEVPGLAVQKADGGWQVVHIGSGLVVWGSLRYRCEALLAGRICGSVAGLCKCSWDVDVKALRQNEYLRDIMRRLTGVSVKS